MLPKINTKSIVRQRKHLVVDFEGGKLFIPKINSQSYIIEFLSKPISRIARSISIPETMYNAVPQNPSRNLLSKAGSQNFPRATLHNPEASSKIITKNY